jgi:hypothetical protein
MIKRPPEQDYDETYIFEAGKPYSFTVVFDTAGRHIDYSNEAAHIDICDGKDYFMACRIFAFGLQSVPAVFAAHPAPVLREPAVSPDNVADIAERSIRLDDLKLRSNENHTGSPVEFSYVIANAGDKDVPIPRADLDKVIMIHYGWKPLSDSAKTTKVIPGFWHFGNAFSAAGTMSISSVHKSNFAPGDRVLFPDKINGPFGPFAPGEYRLHVFLFSRYSTESDKPVQELVQDFSVIP